MNLWHDLSTGPQAPELIHVIVEIPSNTRNKYEFDHNLGIYRLDRVLATSLHYPADYGLIPQTLYDDGDPLDVLIIIKEPTFPGCIITARPLGVFRMMDQEMADDKILAVANADPNTLEYERLEDVPEHYLKEVAHFFSHYKDLEGKRVDSLGWESYESALACIRHAQRLYQEKFGASS